MPAHKAGTESRRIESLTLILFVLALLVAALIVTQTIRRDLKARERLKSESRSVYIHSRAAVTAREPHAPRVRRQTHESSTNRL